MTHSVFISESNTKIFVEKSEHDNYYTVMRDQVWKWLDDQDASWEMEDTDQGVEFIFPTASDALLFKLTWGGA